MYFAIPALLVVFFVVIFGYGIYRHSWKSDFVFNLSKIVPYPAILVDWEPVRVSTYLSDLKTLEKYWHAQNNNSGVFLGIPDSNEIKETLVNKLIDNKIVSIWARKNNIIVLPDEVEDEWQRTVINEYGQAQIDDFLQDYYGWSESQYKNKVLEPILIREKVISALLEKESNTDEALSKKAGEILEIVLDSPDNFAQYATEYNTDLFLKRSSGESGYFPKGVFSPELENKIFTMQIGEISEPIKTASGYHIVKLEDLLFDGQNNPTQANIREILIKSFDFDEWLEEQKNKLAIYRLVQ